MVFPAQSLPRTPIRGGNPDWERGASPPASSLRPKVAAIFILLCGLRKAMAIPAKPVPDSDRGAGLHVPDPWIPAQSLPRTMMRGPE